MASAAAAVVAVLFSFSLLPPTASIDPQQGWAAQKRHKRQAATTFGTGAYCAPLAVFNGQVSYLPTTATGTYASGTTAVLTCTTGFYPSGSSSALCQNGVWSPTLGTCQQSALGGVASSLVSSGSSVYPNYGITANPYASGLTCAALIAPLGGTYTYSPASQYGTFGPFTSGTSAFLYCTNGGTVSGSAQATCSNGQWQPTTMGQCLGTVQTGYIGTTGTTGLGTGLTTAGGCLAALTPLNGQIQYLGQQSTLGTYPQGTTATLICTQGVSSTGQSTATCQNGAWMPAFGYCLSTGTTQYPYYGASTAGLVQSGQLGTGSCLFGLLAPLGATVQYAGVGISSPTQSGPYPSGATATMICQQGVALGSSTAICSNGAWQPSMFTGCSSQQSTLTGSVANTGISALNTGINTLSAGIGTVASGQQCVFGLLGVANGNFAYSSLGPPYASGTVATLQCTGGGLPTGTASSTCYQGQWQPSIMGTCPAVGTNSLLLGQSTPPSLFGSAGQQCVFGMFPPLNGQVTYSTGTTAGPFPANTVATLICATRFIATGQTTAVCQNGAFSPSTLGTCVQTSANPTTPSVGSGMPLQLSSSSSTSAAGNQTALNGVCVSLPQPVNGQFVYSPTGYASPFPVGSTATLVCAPGTQLHDGTSVGRSAVCQSGGQWRGLDTSTACLPQQGTTTATTAVAGGGVDSTTLGSGTNG